MTALDPILFIPLIMLIRQWRYFFYYFSSPCSKISRSRQCQNPVSWKLHPLFQQETHQYYRHVVFYWKPTHRYKVLRYMLLCMSRVHAWYSRTLLYLCNVVVKRSDSGRKLQLLLFSKRKKTTSGETLLK